MRFWVVVKLLQKGVFLEALKHQFGPQLFCQPRRKRGFAGTNASFNCDA